MFILRKSALLLVAALVAAPALSVRPALADGAASTRNIILGGAAATLLILNHNKKVHERYAEDARRQAQVEEQRNNAQAAYDSEKQAYQHEVALVQQYQRETALQHTEVVRERSEIAALKHQLALTGTPLHTAYAAPAAPAPGPRRSLAAAPKEQPTIVSYGWGQL